MRPRAPALIPSEVWSRISYHRRTVRLVEYLAKHPGENMSLGNAASVACMQRNAFSRFFSQKIGMKFSEFHSAFRLELAVGLMMTSDLALSEVSRRAGFNCMSTFERHFLRVVGEPPSHSRSRRMRELLLTSEVDHQGENLQTDIRRGDPCDGD